MLFRAVLSHSGVGLLIHKPLVGCIVVLVVCLLNHRRHWFAAWAIPLAWFLKLERRSFLAHAFILFVAFPALRRAVGVALIWTVHPWEEVAVDPERFFFLVRYPAMILRIHSSGHAALLLLIGHHHQIPLKTALKRRARTLQAKKISGLQSFALRAITAFPYHFMPLHATCEAKRGRALPIDHCELGSLHHTCFNAAIAKARVRRRC